MLGIRFSLQKNQKLLGQLKHFCLIDHVVLYARSQICDAGSGLKVSVCWVKHSCMPDQIFLDVGWEHFCIPAKISNSVAPESWMNAGFLFFCFSLAIVLR